jgi:hypothetical protein
MYETPTFTVEQLPSWPCSGAQSTQVCEAVLGVRSPLIHVECNPLPYSNAVPFIRSVQ